MLILSRRDGERIYIGEEIIVAVTKIQYNRVFLGFEAPKNVEIWREELAQGVSNENFNIKT